MKGVNKLKHKYIERKDYDSKIRIKLVIPSGCNARCKFCYMKNYEDKMKNNKEEFLNNFINSLDFLLKSIDDREKISLDITGNEPTYDIELLKSVLDKLKKFNIQSKVSRVTITTNGLNLEKVCGFFKGVINYVNISIHHYNKKTREKIFGCKTLDRDDYKNIIEKLKQDEITTSAICVVYKDIYNFSTFNNNFINWCKQLGFISLRYRNNVFWKKTMFPFYMHQTLMDSDFEIIQYEETPDSNWCRLRMRDGFRVFFLKGVEDTNLVCKGIEYVISDDGKAYADFFKRERIEDYKFEIGKIYDSEIIISEKNKKLLRKFFKNT